MFYLDFFNIQSWAITNDLPKEKFKAALIVKNTSNNPLIDEADFRSQYLGEEPEEQINPEKVQDSPSFDENFFLTSLTSFIPKSITIAFGERFPDLHQIKFPFIQESTEHLSGVRLARDILEKLDDE
jgi:hypothetical protein